MSYHISSFGNMSNTGQYGSAELQSKINELKPILDNLDSALQQGSSVIGSNQQLQQIQSFSQTSRQTLTSTTVPPAVPWNYPISDAAWKKLDAIETQAKTYIGQVPSLIQQAQAAAAPPPVLATASSSGGAASPSGATPAASSAAPPILDTSGVTSTDGSSNTTYLVLGGIGVMILLFFLLKKKKKPSGGYYPPPPPMGYYPPPPPGYAPAPYPYPPRRRRKVR